jgi:hypothetical protein
MRNAAILAGTTVIFCLAAQRARGNLLVDPGFEVPSATAVDVFLPTSPTGAALDPTYPWYDLLTVAGDQAEISSDIPNFNGGPPALDRINNGTGKNATNGGYTANSGDQYVYAFTVGQSSGTKGGVGQIVTSINAGDTYVGSAYFFDKDFGGAGADGDRLHSGATGASSADSVQLVWENASGTPISTSLSTATLSGGAAGAAGPLENQWVQLTTGPVAAPAGATQVIFELAVTRGSSGGVLFADDASLVDTTSVPEPAMISLISAGFFLIGLRRR